MYLRAAIFGGMMVAASAVVAQTAPVSNDPYIWLEDKDGVKAMAWVEAENAKTLPKLKNDPRYAGYYADALKIAAAEDRIPYPNLTNGRVLNFWRDEKNPHGLWRWTSEADYLTPAPKWTTLVDVDALGKAEGKNWVWKGYSCLQPEERLCLVALSEGGEDAVTFREFDLQTGQFVANGFMLPKSKQDVAWLDKDTLLVARDWGRGTLTASGYPFVVKTLKRGQPLANATEIYRGEASDQGGSGAATLTDAKGEKLTVIVRGKTFFGNDIFVMTPGGLKKLPTPDKMHISGLIDGKVIFTSSEDWGPLKAGTVSWAPLAQVKAGGPLTPAAIFTPTARQSVEGVTTTKTRLLLNYYDNVRGRAAVYTPTGSGWRQSPLALPDNVSVGLAASSDRSDRAFVSVTGFLTPSSLWTVDAVTAKVAQVKATPPRFDASRDVVEQFEATSTDGTKIPYFVVHRKDIPLNGTTPTIMTAYGGFEVSMNPYYSGVEGKLWLEQGGSFVQANIRGGGEFGPAWHEAGRKTKRQIIYDDFASVAKDLFARKLTSAQKLGIYGGSNGGLLMGVEFTEHPDLWRAVTIQVPLLDMLRYEQIEAGASWVDEYGSVSNPDERAFLAKISPYQNLRKGVAYPEPYIWTTTKDDRVGPQHARKFAARMKEYGLPYLYYEDTAGGHSGDADIEQGARLQALQMVYFSQKLLGPAGTK